ncbi:MAG: DUF1134 domain-containing protein [Phyllobacteriaceae bacterium]|nr:DUF1134 domain-containing protein [Phyllobacteriaceae bacterium]
MRKLDVTKTGLARLIGVVLALVVVACVGLASPVEAQDRGGTYSTDELIRTGHKFFGTVSGGLATVIEEAVSRYGQPNGYILGEEGGGAFIGGLRYGEGQLNTRTQGKRKVYWQGPSLGWDFGGEGARTMMLVYNLPATDALWQRFAGVDGSAYFVGGFGMTVLVADHIYVVPVRAGVGLRLGVNVGYLKFTPQATWNPF